MILANPKMELALVTCCLANGLEAVREAQALGIGDESFHELNHRDAWRALGLLAEQGGPVDYTGIELVWPKVVNRNESRPTFLYESLPQAELASDVYRLASEVKNWERRRAVHAAALKLAAVAANPKSDVEEGVAECRGAIQLPPSAGEEEVHGDNAVQTLVEELERRQALNGALSGLATGFPRLDELTDGLQRGEFSVIGARPSHGKSALLISLAAHVVFRLRQPVLFVSLEMSVRALLMRLGSMESDVPSGVMRRGRMNAGEFQRMNGFSLRLMEAPIWLFRGSRGMSVNRLSAMVARHAQENGIVLVLIDYLQKLRSSDREEKRTYELANVTGSLVSMAQENNIHVCAAAQLNREPDKEKEKGRAPRLSDLADCSQIERDADLVCLLHRPPGSPEGTLLVAKQRDGELGAQHLWFDAQHCRFSGENT